MLLMAKRKVHMVDIRLYNNAGIEFPVCYCNDGPLDLEKTGLPKTSNESEVTCKRCPGAFRKRYPWANSFKESKP